MRFLTALFFLAVAIPVYANPLMMLAQGNGYNLSLSPTSKDYGDVNTGSSSSAQQFDASNAGPGTAPLGTFALSGTDPNQFGLSGGTCGATLAPGASCIAGNVVFSPTSEGAKTATIGDGTLSASLNGTGAPNYVMQENFDSGVAPTGWTAASTAIIYNHVPALADTYSLALDSTSTASSVNLNTNTFAGMSDIYVAAKFRYGNQDAIAADSILQILDVSSNTLANIATNNTNPPPLRITTTGGTTTNTGFTFTRDVMVYVQLRYNSATSTSTVWTSTDGVSWMERGSSVGTATAQAAIIRFRNGGDNGTTIFIWDDVWVSSSMISY